MFVRWSPKRSVENTRRSELLLQAHSTSENTTKRDIFTKHNSRWVCSQGNAHSVIDALEHVHPFQGHDRLNAFCSSTQQTDLLLSTTSHTKTSQRKSDTLIIELPLTPSLLSSDNKRPSLASNCGGYVFRWDIVVVQHQKLKRVRNQFSLLD